MTSITLDILLELTPLSSSFFMAEKLSWGVSTRDAALILFEPPYFSASTGAVLRLLRVYAFFACGGLEAVFGDDAKGVGAIEARSCRH